MENETETQPDQVPGATMQTTANKTDKLKRLQRMKRLIEIELQQNTKELLKQVETNAKKPTIKTMIDITQDSLDDWQQNKKKNC